MLIELWQLIVALCALVGGGFGAYGVVKDSIARAQVTAQAAHESSTRAHVRIDDHVSDFHSRKGSKNESESV